MLARIVLIVGGCVGLFQMWRGFVTGAASESGSIRRDERPVLYWSLMVLAGLIVLIFFYFAAFGDFS
jgi:lipid-A-disaccharide synthase-like uncharacterized protein